MTLNTFELMESLVSGHQMTPAELDNLVSNQEAEDLYLEYKHGDELNDKRKARRTIRKYMSGFANSAGGVLIIGVDGKKWCVTGATAPGGGNLAEWASRCLNPIASYFSPVPRFQVIEHSDGNVLVATTARSLAIVPCIESGILIHHFRIHDQTLEAPEYLISDIMLGRRRQPYLQITGLNIIGIITKRDENNNYDLRIRPIFRVENQGMIKANNLRVGIVGLSRTPPNNQNLLSSHLLAHINMENDPAREILHAVKSYADIEPFSVTEVKRFPDIWVPLFNETEEWLTPYHWKAAVYVTAEESAPTWYQLSLVINPELLTIGLLTL